MADKTDLWRRVLAGDETVDFLDLAGLIPTDASESFLWEHFGTLPNARSMIDRILELQSENLVGAYITPDPKHRLGQAQIAILAQAWRRETQAYVARSGEQEFAQDLASDRIAWVFDNRDFLRLAQDYSQPISEIADYLSDEYSTYLRVKSPWGYALDEALLRLTTYPAITRWLMEDIVGFPMKSRAYYDLWRAGGDVLFMKGHMVVLCEAGPG